jgi:hypothetical protein
MTQHFQGLLQKCSRVEDLADLDRHYLYQVIIQHGLTGDGTATQMDTMSLSVDRSSDLITKDDLHVLSTLFFHNFQRITEIILHEIAQSNANTIDPTDNNKARFDLVKEGLSALSYFFSGIWISESLLRQQELKTRKLILETLFKPFPIVSLQKLKQSLLLLQQMNHPEINLILLFLLSKQEVSFLFDNHFPDWCEFLHKTILQEMKKVESTKLDQTGITRPTSLYTQQQPFPSLYFTPSMEIIYSLEAIEKLFSFFSARKLIDQSQPQRKPTTNVIINLYPNSLSHTKPLQIPENALHFFVNQFLSLETWNNHKSSEVEGENEVQKKAQLIQEDMKKEIAHLLLEVILHLDSELLKPFFKIIINRFLAVTTKFW